jgi:hypothetical protein
MMGYLIGILLAIIGAVGTTVAVGAHGGVALLIGMAWGFAGFVLGSWLEGDF